MLFLVGFRDEIPPAHQNVAWCALGLAVLTTAVVFKLGNGRRTITDVPGSTLPLGITLPAQLHDPVLTVFRQLGVPVLSAGSPRSSASGVVFLIDADDYIIARDFEVDVPEFVHEAEWFQPDAPGNAG
jgi:hypothetical protein